MAESDVDIERKRAAAAAAAWSGQPPVQPTHVEDTQKYEESTKQPGPNPAPKLEGLSLEELEAELARRKGVADRSA